MSIYYLIFLIFYQFYLNQFPKPLLWAVEGISKFSR